VNLETGIYFIKWSINGNANKEIFEDSVNEENSKNDRRPLRFLFLK